ncbi:MAG: Gfo/Idh/MocA family oxidoreductase [Verrucomicrobia bacterium]|nr:Gfo/Idh/MocA family oxidoreductase [Verrucomicrobiota bacterium]
MTRKPVRTAAVIGAGSIGYRHLRNLEKLGVNRLLIHDPSATRSARIRAEHPSWIFCPKLSDLAAEVPDAVVVASPSALHEEHTRAALAWNCAIFVEKPLSPGWGEVERLAQEALAKQVVTMVACNMRFHPGPAKVRQLLKSCAIGELISYRIHCGSYLPDWHSDQDYRQSYSASTETGGAILDCIHELDLALWYAGPGQLAAARHLPARSIGLETDGLAEILIQHDAGAVGSIHLNFVERDYRRSCICIGSEGTLEWNFHRPELVQYGLSADEVIKHPLPNPWELNEMYVDEMRHFLSCIAEGHPTENSIAQSLPCLRLALDARNAGCGPHTSAKEEAI